MFLLNALFHTNPLKEFNPDISIALSLTSSQNGGTSFSILFTIPLSLKLNIIISAFDEHSEIFSNKSFST